MGKKKKFDAIKIAEGSIYINSDEILKKIKISSQKELTTEKDLQEVLALNEALWTTTGASIEAINCDAVFLDHLDFDDNSRIMCFEVKAGIQWILKNLRDRQGLIKSSEILKLDAINTDHKEGRDIAISCSQVLRQLRKSDKRELSLQEIREIKKEIEQTPISSAGAIMPEAAEKIYLKNLLLDVIKTTGGIRHPSGQEGVSKEKLDFFFNAAEQYVKWFTIGRLKEGETVSAIQVLGEDTEKAFGVYKELRGKIDEYFSQCSLASYKRSQIGSNTSIRGVSGVLPEIAETSEEKEIREFLKKAPLAKPDPELILKFTAYINCYYGENIKRFYELVATPFFPDNNNRLTAQQWREIKTRFTPFEEWQKEKSGQEVASLNISTLEKYLDPEIKKEAHKLIDYSIEAALMMDEVRLIEKLILYQANLMVFLNNFVYFPYLYNPQKRAMFEMGSLVMDGRIFKLSFRVKDHAKHVEFSKRSNMYIIYANVFSENKKLYEIAVPVTAGGKGNLYIGKRGIFHDTDSRDWDAEVIEILENPISILEAFYTPFQKLTKLINSKIEELKNAAETKLNTVVKDTKLPEQPLGAKPGYGNIFMGGGIAIAAIGSAMAFITKTLSDVKWYTVVITLLGALAAVMLPTFISAFNKLRKRNLSAILEASGWAVNVRMNLTFKLGRFFTQKPIRQKFLRKLKFLTWLIPLVATIILIILIILYRGELLKILADITEDLKKTNLE